MKHVNHPESSKPSPPLVLTNEGIAWLGVALLMGALGWWKSISLVLLLAYVMLGLLIINGVLARAHAGRVRAVREQAVPVYAGESAAVRATVTNTGRRSATVSVEDRGGSERVGWLVNRLLPGTSTTCDGRHRILTRGRYRSALRISSGFPLGLLQYERPDNTETELLVLPAAGFADADGLRQWWLRHVGGDGRARRVLRRVTIDQADVRGVRPYRPGDPIRAIHWRSSARRNELMVREYDSAPAPDLVLVVEPWLPPTPTDTDRDALEAALGLAVTVARTWGAVHGTKVVVAVAGDNQSVGGAGGSEESLRTALAPLAGVVGADSIDVLDPRVFDRSLGRAARVVVSSRANTPYADAMSRATGKRFVALSPADDLPWYHPPAPVVRGQKSEARSQKSETAPRRGSAHRPPSSDL